MMSRQIILMTPAQLNHLKQQAAAGLAANDLANAKAFITPAHQAYPNDPEVNWLLADLFVAQGYVAQGVGLLKKAAERKSNLGFKEPLLEKASELCGANQLHQLGFECASSWLKHCPKSDKARFFVGLFLFQKKRYSECITQLKKLLKQGSKTSGVYKTLGEAQYLSGEHQAAYDYYQQAIALAPSAQAVKGNFLLASNAMPFLSEESVSAEHVSYAKTLENEVVPHDYIPPAKRPKKLRLGFTSDEFRSHSIAYFLLPLLRGIDKNRYEVFCYSDTDREDSFTAEIKSFCDGWHDATALSDDALVALIRQHKVDILVDLNGHTGAVRFHTYISKSAPVQVTYLAYPNTTGFSRIDYRLSDYWADPENTTEHLHSEALVRLPGGFLCFEPAPDAPEPSFVNRTKAGQVVCFGSFNAFQKITDDVISVWARVLLAVEGSSLLVKSTALGDAGVKDAFKRKFKQHGISSKRLILLNHTPGRVEHLGLYAKVDIHLDTFPYNGTTTTCEAFWQGVPSIVLAGSSHRARVGVSILNQLGLNDFIAKDLDDYVSLAVSKASDLAALEALRATMRERMLNSPLMQTERFAKDFSEAVELMYGRYLSSQPDS